jgi:predicted CXXCH cytochrome family protein
MDRKHRIDGEAGTRRFASLLATMAVALAGAAICLPASAQLAAPKDSGVSTTKHNLGSGGTGNNRQAVDTTIQATEVCVFCHTPHAANTAVGPLWNRTAGTPTFTPYTSASLRGGTYNATTGMGTALEPGAISLACLSCHDGVTAMNTLINAPGSGGWNAAGATFGAIAAGAGTGKITGVAAVGSDGLANDHPIGVKYAGGAATDADRTLAGYNKLETGTINLAPAFWVEAAGAATGSSRQKADMWLYARADGSPYVECASCHDPHTENPTFLRTKNDYSSVCLSCHIK